MLKNGLKAYYCFLVHGAFFFALGVGVANAAASSKYSACFKQAESYYEQIYCEVKAKGEGGSLPSFADFKKNNQQMQALLLKRKAEALKIPFKMPAKKQASLKKEKTKKIDANNQMALAADCQYLERTIQCGDGIFSIVGNKRNNVLENNVLSSGNKLGLGRFAGDPNNKTLVLQYLTTSYTRYIEKMLEIGLAGSTMSFTKFYYLFQDLSAHGVSFHQRFESMYDYLKVDKRSLGVTEGINVIRGLTIADCSRLNRDLFTCDNGKVNRVYRK